MNHTPAINIWKGSNRVSLLWEELLADLVSPDPPAEENISARETWEREVDLLAARSEQVEPAEPGLLERAGFESLRMFRQALEILTSPPEQELASEDGRGLYLETPFARQAEWDETNIPDRMQAVSTPVLTYIKVSSEPEPQPGSAIDTRRIAYGLKIPARPLHKRPIYQRLFFSLRGWIRMISRGSFEPSP